MDAVGAGNVAPAAIVCDPAMECQRVAAKGELLRTAAPECRHGPPARHIGPESPKVPKFLLGRELVTTTPSLGVMSGR